MLAQSDAECRAKSIVGCGSKVRLAYGRQHILPTPTPPNCSTYLASKARAKTPAASGAAALVPEWVVVHLP